MERFDFNLQPPVRFLEDMGEDEVLHMINPFNSGEETCLVQLLMLRAELAQYKLLSANRSGCRWMAYIQELMENAPLPAVDSGLPGRGQAPGLSCLLARLSHRAELKKGRHIDPGKALLPCVKGALCETDEGIVPGAIYTG